jgi:hypothetical protein
MTIAKFESVEDEDEDDDMDDDEEGMYDNYPSK